MPDRLELLSDRLSQALADDASSIVAPAFDQFERRSRRRRRTRAAGAAVCSALAVGVALTALPSGPPRDRLAVEAGPVLLDQGTDVEGPWQLTAGADGCYRVLRATSRSAGCDFPDPPTLDGSSGILLGDDGRDLTVVVGPAPAGTTEVRVTTTSGASATARTRPVAGTPWFSVRVDGVQSVRTLRATDGQGRTLAAYDGPALPPPPPRPTNPPPSVSPDGIQAPPAVHLSATDEFGRISDIAADGSWLRVERVDMLTGDAATRAAREDGREPDGDYYLRERPEFWTRYQIDPAVVVWGSIRLNRTVEHGRVPLDQLIRFIDTDRAASETLFHFDVQEGVVVGVEEQYRP
jgi:hypothetical protein